MARLAVNLRVVLALGARSVKQTFRRPQLAAPILVFPTLLLAVQTGGAGGAVDLPGFPEVDNFLSFMLAGAMLQSCLLAGNTGGIALAVDLEMGFTDRLLRGPDLALRDRARPARRDRRARRRHRALVHRHRADLRRLVRGGDRGMLLMIVFTSLSAVAFGGLSAAIALYTGQASVVQGLFPLIFVILFLSSAFFPINLLLEPAASIAEYNPLSFIVEGIREPVIGSLTAANVAEAFGAIALVGAISTALSAVALRRRLRVG